MNVHVFGALFTLRIQYQYIQTQCNGGAKYVNVYLKTHISSYIRT